MKWAEIIKIIILWELVKCLNLDETDKKMNKKRKKKKKQKRKHKRPCIPYEEWLKQNPNEICKSKIVCIKKC